MYYRLKKKFDSDNYGITKYPDLPNPINRAFNGDYWTQGPDGNMLVFEVNYKQNDVQPADLVSVRIPILSDRFINALNEIGIDNMQIYEAKLINPETGDSWGTGFKAVNFVGVVDCVDMEESSYDDIGAGIVTFNNMIIQSNKVKGHLCFRVPQAKRDIIFSQSAAFELMEKYPYLVGVGFKKIQSI